MMKRTFAALLAAAVLLSACAGNEVSAPPAAEPSVSSPAEESVSEPASETADEIKSPEAVLIDDKDTITLYQYFESGVYENEKELALPENPTLADVFFAVEEAVMPKTDITALRSVDIQKGWITYDIDRAWLDSHNKGDLTVFANSLATTLFENVECGSVGFMVDGEFGLFGDTVWKTEPLRLLDNPTAEAFDKIRDKVPYPGIDEDNFIFISMDDYKAMQPEATRNDATADEIRRLLASVGEVNEEVDSPAELDMKNVILYLIWSTPYVTTDKTDDGVYSEELEPLAASVSEKMNFRETCFWLEEHLEETAKIIYGDDFVIEHQKPYLPYKYWDTEGVYTPPHMGGGWNIIPIVYSYTEEGDTVTAEVAMLMENMNGYMDAIARQNGGFGEGEIKTVQRKELNDFIENEITRRTVTMHREADGRLTFVSHHFAK